VSQDARCVTIYRRADGGQWHAVPEIYRQGAGFELPGLTRAISVHEVSAGLLDEAGRLLLR